MIVIAAETIKAIDRAIEKDQGAKYRGILKTVLPHIGDAYRDAEEGHRSHLGASILGHECARAVWYNFRWMTKPRFSGQMLRLFNRGHLEEGRVISALLLIGIKIYQQDAEGKQFRISFADGHAGGSGDGVAIGVPDLRADQPSLLEFKTHNKKSFESLAGDNWKDYVAHLLDPNKPAVKFTGEGVRAAKFEHYVQASLYMRKMGIAVCLYIAVCKDNDLLYIELIPLDVELADQFLERGEKLVWMQDAPKRMSETPGFWKCKFCDHRPVCHLKALPDVNCRSCAYSEPVAGAQWNCRKHEKEIPKDVQQVGCPQYEVKKCS